MEKSGELKDKETPEMKKRLIASLCFLIPLMYLSMGHMMWGWKVPEIVSENHVAMGIIQLLLTTAVMVINQKFFISGWKGMIHRAPNMDTLVALGVSGFKFDAGDSIYYPSNGTVSPDEHSVSYTHLTLPTTERV